MNPIPAEFEMNLHWQMWKLTMRLLFCIARCQVRLRPIGELEGIEDSFRKLIEIYES